MEFPVAALEALGDALDRFDDIEGGDQVAVHFSHVPDQAENGLIAAPGNMYIHILLFDPGDQVIDLFVSASGFQYNNHVLIPLFLSVFLFSFFVPGSAV